MASRQCRLPGLWGAEKSILQMEDECIHSLIREWLGQDARIPGRVSQELGYQATMSQLIGGDTSPSQQWVGLKAPCSASLGPEALQGGHKETEKPLGTRPSMAPVHPRRGSNNMSMGSRWTLPAWFCPPGMQRTEITAYDAQQGVSPGNFLHRMRGQPSVYIS